MPQEYPVQVILSELDKPSEIPFALLKDLQQMYSKNGATSKDLGSRACLLLLQP